MTLISIILALIAERFLSWLQDYRQFEWLEHTVQWLRKQSAGLDSMAGAVLILAILGIAVEIIYFSVMDWFSLAGFALGSIILIACLGPKSFYEQIKQICVAQDRGNEESSLFHLENIKDYPLTDEEKHNIERTTLESLFVVTNDRMLAVIFWFAIVGPIGAVIFRIASVMHFTKTEDERPAIYVAFDRLYYLINWPTARLVALSYAVVGNWLDSVAHLKKPVSPGTNWPDPNAQLLANVGISSLALDEEDNKTFSYKDITNGLALVRRSVAFWVGVIALLTLAGWLG